MSRDLVAMRAAVDRGAPLSEDADVQVVRRADGTLNHVRVSLPSPTSLEALSRDFGPPRELPRLPSGARRAVFPDTGPRDGERTTTVLAELDRAGRVTAVVLRPDDLSAG